MNTQNGFPTTSAPFVNAGRVLQQPWYNFLITLWQRSGGANGGLNITLATAKLTPTGAGGSMTFTNGILTAQTPAT